jgi:peptide deformylase
MANITEIAPPKLYEILTYPNPILKQISEPVLEVNQEIKDLIQNMYITMYKNEGVGLSAIQVGIPKRIFVMDTSNSGDRRYAFINPDIISATGEHRWREGCLSFPNIFAYVKRATNIKIRALNEKGEVFELDLQGVDAVCSQHEFDHLSGVTFYDHLSALQKNMIRKKISNLKN